MSWTIDEAGALAYTLTGPPPRSLSGNFNPGMLVVVLLADGRRTMGDIYDRLVDLGFSMQDPADVLLIFQALERINAVAMRWHVESFLPLRHICYGGECGECCEGHLVGPLSLSEAKRLHEQREALKQLEPDLVDGLATMEVQDEQEPVLAINFLPGHCVFFGKDRLCAVHRHYGLRSKPLICQLFPVRVLQTEAGFRVGISPQCTMTHRSFQTAEPLSLPEFFESVGVRRPPGAIVGLDPSRVRSLRATPIFENNLQQESYFLSLVAIEGLSFTDLINSSTGTLQSGRPLPSAYLAEVSRRLRRFPERYRHSPLDLPTSRYGQHVRRFIADLARLPEPPAPWIEPVDPVRAYLLFSLSQFVYLRETSRFPQVETGIQVALIGLIGALWTTPEWTDGDRVHDELGRRMAYWYRMINVARSYQFLFDDADDYQVFRGLLGE
ncbi:MAG: YkgJ family cysteine cluster protein [Bradymonadales bacterium]|nr:YkgJ family cysteine cluster protein [Bradymonadales bacterium]